MKSNWIYIALYFVMFAIHFLIWNQLNIGFEDLFIRYYLFLTLLFMMVITVMSIFKTIYPNYLGFVFLGLVLIKLTLMMIVMKKLKISDVPDFKFHFILPYLISLTLVTLCSINIIKKDEKN